MPQKPLVLFACVFFSIVLHSREYANILMQKIITLLCMLASNVLDKPQSFNMTMNSFIFAAVACWTIVSIQQSVFVVQVQTSLRHWQGKVTIGDALDMPWSKDGKISFLREFTSIPLQKYWTFPSSLREYLNKTEQDSKEECMNYEWGRYESFKDFPMSAPVTPMRLASSGFYYTGVKDAVVCFSCKLKYSGWKDGDRPETLHKHLSPACDFIRGTDTSNVPIHSQSTSKPTSNSPEYPTVGAVGGGSYTAQCSKDCESINSHGQGNTRSTREATDAETSRRINHKFPDYKNVQHRKDTFNPWPCAEVVDPVALVAAGFFYAGFSDCVRCFSCGGGLRNWEYGDGPWEEHARWFPWCKFLIEQKGLVYIRQFQEAQNGSDGEMPKEAIVSGEEALKTLEGFRNKPIGNSKDIEADKREGDDEIERKFTRDAFEKLNEMGFMYSFSQISKIVYRFKRNGGQLSTESVITYVIDNPENFEDHEQVWRNNSIETNIQNVPELEKVTVGSNRCDSKAEKEVVQDERSSRDNSNEEALTSADPNMLKEANAKIKNQLLCKICMDSDSDVVFIPCGHMVSCEKCAPHIRKCAVCRMVIKGRVKAFVS